MTGVATLANGVVGSRLERGTGGSTDAASREEGGVRPLPPRSAWGLVSVGALDTGPRPLFVLDETPVAWGLRGPHGAAGVSSSTEDSNPGPAGMRGVSVGHGARGEPGTRELEAVNETADASSGAWGPTPGSDGILLGARGAAPTIGDEDK